MHPKNFSLIRAPFYSSILSCGLFGVADDFTESYLSLDEKFLSHKESTFLVRVSGDSMAPEICDGDILIIDRSARVFHGCVATFHLNGHGICKQYLKSSQGIVLHSYNPKVKDIVIKEEDDFILFGVAIGLARSLVR